MFKDQKKNWNHLLLHQRSPAGFTLIEIMLVVVIVSIIALVSVPGFRGSYQYLRFENTVRNFTKLVRYGQDLAIMRSRPYRLHIEARENRYWLERADEKGKRFVPLTGKWGRKTIIPDTIEIKSKKKNYHFYIDGKSDSGEVVFILKDKFTTTVKLYGSRGSFEIKEESKKRR